MNCQIAVALFVVGQLIARYLQREYKIVSVLSMQLPLTIW